MAEDERLMKLQHFFEVDLAIKKEMHNMAPPSDNQYDDIEKYSDRINDSLIYIFSELKCIASDFFGLESQIMNKIITMENNIKNIFLFLWL